MGALGESRLNATAKLSRDIIPQEARSVSHSFFSFSTDKASPLVANISERGYLGTRPTLDFGRYDVSDKGMENRQSCQFHPRGGLLLVVPHKGICKISKNAMTTVCGLAGMEADLRAFRTSPYSFPSRGIFPHGRERGEYGSELVYKLGKARWGVAISRSATTRGLMVSF